jgi:hypothetical protein
MIQKIAKNLKRATHLNDFLSGNDKQVSFYEIVYAIESDSFKTSTIAELDTEVTLAFTEREDALKHSSEENVVAIMLGKLIQESCHEDHINIIGLNYNEGKFDNFIFVPFYDKLTKQYLISPTDESIALLSIDQKSHRHMGVQATFFSINNKFLPEENDARAELLANLVEDLSFMIPRISQPKGSANIICLLLNLENGVEEKAFIRKYKTLDCYTEVLFVTSDLKLQTGELESIQYDGTNLEGIYTPIISRQKM